MGFVSSTFLSIKDAIVKGLLRCNLNFFFDWLVLRGAGLGKDPAS